MNAHEHFQRAFEAFSRRDFELAAAEAELAVAQSADDRKTAIFGGSVAAMSYAVLGRDRDAWDHYQAVSKLDKREAERLETTQPFARVFARMTWSGGRVVSFGG